MKAVWCDQGLVRTPYEFCLCLTEAQFKKELKRLKIQTLNEFQAENKGATIQRFTSDSGRRVAFVCLPHGKRTLNQAHALLVHEATHLWQWTCEDLDEREPSMEFEAYAIETISERLFEAYDRLTKKK